MNLNANAPVFHALFQGEKFSDMVAHFGGTEEIQDDTTVHLTEFEDRLVSKTGYRTLVEAEEHIKEVMREDETKYFATVFENGKAKAVLHRHYGLLL